MQLSNSILKRHPSPKTTAHSKYSASYCPVKCLKSVSIPCCFLESFFASLSDVSCKSFKYPTPCEMIKYAEQGFCLKGFTLLKNSSRINQPDVFYLNISPPLCTMLITFPPTGSLSPLIAYIFFLVVHPLCVFFPQHLYDWGQLYVSSVATQILLQVPV